MRVTGWSGAAAVLLLVAGGAGGGCGDDGGGSAGAGASGGADGAGGGGASGGGTPGSTGDCDGDEDCPGTACVEVTPGGFRVCRVDFPEAVACNQDPSFDECCTTQECASGACMLTPIVPFCSGVQPMERNVCVADQCASDESCGEGNLCAPAGTLGRKVRACAPAPCKVNGDCTAEPGGSCAPVRDACCGADVGLRCVYPSDGCRESADCPSGSYCEAGEENDGRARCVSGIPTCPA